MSDNAGTQALVVLRTVGRRRDLARADRRRLPTSRAHRPVATRVVAALVLFVVSGCTATATSERAAATPMRSVSSTMSSPGIPTLPCTDPVDALNSMGARGVPILDAVAIGVQAAPVTFYADPDGGLGFGKVWLWIRANYPATLTLPRGAGAEMRWSNTEDKPQGRTFRTPVCRAGDATWTAYPGGFLLPRPACLPLTVSADGHTTTVTIAIGRPCLHPPDAISGLALAKATT